MNKAAGFIVLCAADSLKEGQSMGFEAGRGDAAVEGFLVRKSGRVFAYENCCPHTGAPLDWVEHQFLTRGKEHIMCATHGALFRIETGECLAGPCQGAWLRALAVEIRDGMIVLACGAGRLAGRASLNQ